MKKYKKVQWIFLALSLVMLNGLFTACQKEISSDLINNTNPNPPAVVSDSVYLDKIYNIYTNGSQIDTGDIGTFQYDASKRLVSINFTSGIQSGTPEYQKYTYYYMGSDTMPYKYTYYDSIDFSGTQEALLKTSYLFYDATGNLVRDSSIKYSRSYPSGSLYERLNIKNYQYNGSQIYGTEFDSVTNATGGWGADPFLSLDTANLDARGNVISSVTHQYNRVTGSLDFSSESTFSWDDKNNPLYKLSIRKTGMIIPKFETLLVELIFRNNVTHIRQEDITNGDILEYDINGYNYNSAGYPTRSTIRDVVTGESGTTIFTYKAL